MRVEELYGGRIPPTLPDVVLEVRIQKEIEELIVHHQGLALSYDSALIKRCVCGIHVDFYEARKGRIREEGEGVHPNFLTNE